MSSLDYKLVELLLYLKTASYINNICSTRFFYKKHFYKLHQAEIGKKLSKY